LSILFSNVIRRYTSLRLC